MPAPAALIVAWARSAVAPHGGAFSQLQPHEIAAPVIQALLQRAGVSPASVDALVAGNALGAGGNPARMAALAAGLPEACAAYSIDTQCCSGLDAVAMGVGLLASGQASVVIAGGVEAWTRSPIRMHRPMHPGESATAYERPAFAPDPARDPDLLVSAARYASQQRVPRMQQDAYAVLSHQRALASRELLRSEIIPIASLQDDAYPRTINEARAARMPVAIKPEQLGEGWSRNDGPDCSLSTLAISTKADGAAFVLLATEEACRRLGITARAAWVSHASIGGAPETPLLAAEKAARVALARAGSTSIESLAAIELHDAFAVQGLSFCKGFGTDPTRINRHGGGLARGHPIGASGAIALVRVLADLERDAAPGARGLTAVAAAGGLGSAAIVQRG